MSEDTHEEGQHRRPHSQAMAAPFLELDLTREMAQFHSEPEWKNGHNARTLVKDDDFRIVTHRPQGTRPDARAQGGRAGFHPHDHGSPPGSSTGQDVRSSCRQIARSGSRTASRGRGSGRECPPPDHRVARPPPHGPLRWRIVTSIPRTAPTFLPEAMVCHHNAESCTLVASASFLAAESTAPVGCLPRLRDRIRPPCLSSALIRHDVDRSSAERLMTTRTVFTSRANAASCEKTRYSA